LKEFESDYFSNIHNVPNVLPEIEDLSINSYIENFYPNIGKVKGIFSFGSLDINSRNVKVVTEEGTFTLKFWEELPKKRLEEIVKILLFLGSQKMRVPVPILNCDGKYFSGPQHEIATLFSYVDGELYRPTPHNLGDFFEATGQLFSNLGKITKVMESSNSHVSSSIETQKSIRDSFENNQLWVDLDLTEFQECLMSMWPLIKRDLDSFIHLNRLSKMQYSHYDLHPKNVVFDSHKSFGFLDFSSCTISNPNIAWGFLLTKNLRQAVVTSDKHDDVKLLASKAILDLQKIDFSQNLDVTNLPVYGRYEIARRLAYILDEYTKKGLTVWMSMLPVQIRLLKESYLLFGDD
jgi:hypothetical protein